MAETKRSDRPTIKIIKKSKELLSLSLSYSKRENVLKQTSSDASHKLVKASALPVA